MADEEIKRRINKTNQVKYCAWGCVIGATCCWRKPILTTESNAMIHIYTQKYIRAACSQITGIQMFVSTFPSYIQYSTPAVVCEFVVRKFPNKFVDFIPVFPPNTHNIHTHTHTPISPTNKRSSPDAVFTKNTTRFYLASCNINIRQREI